MNSSVASVAVHPRRDVRLKRILWTRTPVLKPQPSGYSSLNSVAPPESISKSGMLGIRFTVTCETPFSLEVLPVITVPRGVYTVLAKWTRIISIGHEISRISRRYVCANVPIRFVSLFLSLLIRDMTVAPNLTYH